MKPEIRVEYVLQQKIYEIQSRVPLKMRIAQDASFSGILQNQQEKLANKTLQLDTSVPVRPDASKIHQVDTSKRKYPLVSGSYEAEYPRLSAEEISALMPRINEAIANASSRYGIDQNMIRAIIKQESSFQPLALSTSGAMGLMQLMPETAMWLSVTDPYNIEQNITGGTRYFRDQLETFSGNYELALAAYNAGPNAVKKYNGIPPIPQTQNYVKKVMEYFNMYSSMQR